MRRAAAPAAEGLVLGRQIDDAVERLRVAAQEAARRADALDRPVLAWAALRVSDTDPVEVFARGAGAARERTLWTRPSERFGLAGIGTAWEFSAAGNRRFEDAAQAWRSLVAESVGEGRDAGGPIAVAGFSFDPEVGAPEAAAHWEGFAAGGLVLPRAMLAQVAGESVLTLATVVRRARQADDEVSRLATGLRMIAEPAARADGVEPEGGSSSIVEEFPIPEHWKGIVADAASTVRGGSLRKVVLARAVRVRVRGATPAGLVSSLRDGYPDCAIFAFARNGRCFLGASPELLVRVEGAVVKTAAVAGSAPRGAMPDEDRRLGDALLASAKDRLEHAVVVDDIRDAMEELCDQVSAPGAPALFKVANVQHLYTPVTGRLRDHQCILDFVRRLHPTPAVGGAPREAALRWMRAREGWDRGWYAGPVGWIDAAGEGEFVAAIRSALLRGDEALLFAGCGIVADSDPDAEYAESQLKLRPMLSAMGLGP